MRLVPFLHVDDSKQRPGYMQTEQASMDMAFGRELYVPFEQLEHRAEPPELYLPTEQFLQSSIETDAILLLCKPAAQFWQLVWALISVY
jgi:hypothetical protein